MKTGRFISLEGIDGAGKSSHLEAIEGYLREQGYPVLLTREPGGTPLGEQLRSVLLQDNMSRETELLLMFAARVQHIQTVIEPALQRGDWVVCDRFVDASFAYQCGGRGVPVEHVQYLSDWLLGSILPDLTLLFDVPEHVGRARREERIADRFEREPISFDQQVRHAYLARAAQAPHRFCVLDANANIIDVRRHVLTALKNLVEMHCA